MIERTAPARPARFRRRLARGVVALLVAGLGAAAAARDDAAPWIAVPGGWSADAALAGYDGVARYRAYVRVPEAWAGASLRFEAGAIDDADETFVNGVRIGATGAMPPAPRSAWSEPRAYAIPSEALRAGAWNVIEVRVHDSGGEGGITRGPVRLRHADGASIDLAGRWRIETGDAAAAPTSADEVEAAGWAFLMEMGVAAPGRLLPSIAPSRAAVPAGHVLWYEQPAASWSAALPIGNGRLGAMVHGGVDEHLQLNEESVWAGAPREREREVEPGFIPAMQRMILEGDVAAAQRILQERFMSERLIISHQTLGDLRIEMVTRRPEQVAQYRRALDLATGLATTDYEIDDVVFRHAAFASAPDGVLVYRIAADETAAVNRRVVLSRPELPEGRATVESLAGAARLRLEGRATNGEHAGVRFRVEALVVPTCGFVAPIDLGPGIAAVDVGAADELLVILAAATDYPWPDPEAPRPDPARCAERIDAAAALGFAALLERHVDDHAALFDRFDIDLGWTPAAARPTDVRLAALRDGAEDPALAALFVQHARYLLMASSRPGSMPANLQGLWNEHLAAPWNADYHLNINLQMNYWPAEALNLADCHEPLFDATAAIARRGATTARKLYDRGGWVAHHVSDAWWFTVPIGRTVWGLWPWGGAWLTRHLVEHWRYGDDDDFLRDRAWPLTRGAAEFVLDGLVVDPASGLLVAGPSSSPENAYRLPDGSVVDVGMGNAMDLQIARDLLGNLLEMAAALGIAEDDAIALRAAEALPRLAPTRIGDDGRILEWSAPREEVEPGHRHMSHLYGLHPAREIDPARTPALAAAARRTIDARLEHGGGHTGWSRAWLINLLARLDDGDAAERHLRLLLEKSTLPNLFDDHPPFQIDGNFGGAAGVAEMLLRDDGTAIRLLPALPAAWPTGSVRGLRAPHGVAVDLEWRNGRLHRATLRAEAPRRLRVRIGERTLEHEVVPGVAWVIEEP